MTPPPARSARTAGRNPSSASISRTDATQPRRAPPGAAYAARYGENDAALKTRLETVRTAAEALTSGQELGLVRDRRLLTAGWESGEVDTLFAAIAAGAAIA